MLHRKEFAPRSAPETAIALRDAFPETYAESREAFVREVSARGAELESHRHPRSGPNGEALFLDVARFGASEADATRVLFVGCGTHGVEGRAGSGILLAALAQGSLDVLPRGLAVVLVHAINPYGFAHDRRVDHENVDVNRNFIDHSSPHPSNEHYELLRAVLNPETHVARGLGAEAIAAMALHGALHGMKAVYRGAGGGQYRYPDELAYCGVEPCWSNRTIRAVWAKHVGARVDLAVFVDLHTGLGPRGVGTILQGADPDDPRVGLAEDLFGRVHRTPRPGPGRTIVFGELVTAFEDSSLAKRSLGVILEIGTHEVLKVFMAVRAEAWLHRRGDPRSPEGRAIKRAMRDAFFVDEPSFRDAVLERGIEVIEDAIAGMKTR